MHSEAGGCTKAGTSLRNHWMASAHIDESRKERCYGCERCRDMVALMGVWVFIGGKAWSLLGVKRHVSPWQRECVFALSAERDIFHGQDGTQRVFGGARHIYTALASIKFGFVLSGAAVRKVAACSWGLLVRRDNGELVVFCAGASQMGDDTDPRVISRIPLVSWFAKAAPGTKSSWTYGKVVPENKQLLSGGNMHTVDGYTVSIKWQQQPRLTEHRSKTLPHTGEEEENAANRSLATLVVMLSVERSNKILTLASVRRTYVLRHLQHIEAG
ncbi:hypothetical protein Tco_1042530 [Tanacetum coccineum]|uniref:Uncharacterized protein n=1 Tax=Tanacetum coccineum TaxID=301880 RepID=A0ABQ5GK01_9ASTR